MAYVITWKVILIVILCVQWSGLQITRSKKPSTIRTRRTTLGFAARFLQKMAKDAILYNPNYGYEPYWADGEGVLTTTTQHPNISTTIKPTVCHEECNYLLRRIKEVCGHRSENITRVSCPDFYVNCSGRPGIDLGPGYETFNTYCQFLDAQCRDKYHESRYVLVHIGKCMTQNEAFKPLWGAWDTMTRKVQFLKDYYSRYSTEPDRK